MAAVFALQQNTLYWYQLTVSLLVTDVLFNFYFASNSVRARYCCRLSVCLSVRLSVKRVF